METEDELVFDQLLSVQHFQFDGTRLVTAGEAPVLAYPSYSANSGWSRHLLLRGPRQCTVMTVRHDFEVILKVFLGINIYFDCFCRNRFSSLPMLPTSLCRTLTQPQSAIMGASTSERPQ